MKSEAQPGTPEDFDFFVTTGDNLYALDANKPLAWEFEKMMDMFLTRDSIKDLPIYPVRGNHDCYFDDMDVEIALSKQYPTWNFPNQYYEQQFEVANGKKFSLL